MNAPASFVSKLQSTFNGRLRIRWSLSQREFHIEQRVGHSFMPSAFVDEGDDAMIRAVDGYFFLMAIRDGDRMPCPTCGFTVRVPVRDTVDIKCSFCELQGKQTRFVAGFWPLDDSLIQHLKKHDPTLDHLDEVAGEADYRNRLLLQSEENDAANPGEAEAEQLYQRLVGIQQVGYTGKEF